MRVTSTPAPAIPASGRERRSAPGACAREHHLGDAHAQRPLAVELGEVGDLLHGKLAQAAGRLLHGDLARFHLLENLSSARASIAGDLSHDAEHREEARERFVHRRRDDPAGVPDARAAADPSPEQRRVEVAERRLHRVREAAVAHVRIDGTRVSPTAAATPPT